MISCLWDRIRRNCRPFCSRSLSYHSENYVIPIELCYAVSQPQVWQRTHSTTVYAAIDVTSCQLGLLRAWSGASNDMQKRWKWGWCKKVWWSSGLVVVGWNTRPHLLLFPPNQDTFPRAKSQASGSDCCLRVRCKDLRPGEIGIQRSPVGLNHELNFEPILLVVEWGLHVLVHTSPANKIGSVIGLQCESRRWLWSCSVFQLLCFSFFGTADLHCMWQVYAFKMPGAFRSLRIQSTYENGHLYLTGEMRYVQHIFLATPTCCTSAILAYCVTVVVGKMRLCWEARVQLPHRWLSGYDCPVPQSQLPPLPALTNLSIHMYTAVHNYELADRNLCVYWYSSLLSLQISEVF